MLSGVTGIRTRVTCVVGKRANHSSAASEEEEEEEEEYSES